MLRRAVDASAYIGFPACDRSNVDDMSGIPHLHLCSGMSVVVSYSRPGRHTVDERLGHVNESENIGIEHPLHVSRGYLTNAFRSKDIASVINCGMACEDCSEESTIYHTYQGRQLISARLEFY